MSEFCTIQSDLIVYGERLMDRNTNLREWDSSLTALVDGTNMFRCCYNLEDFRASTPNLTNATGMFERCGLTYTNNTYYKLNTENIVTGDRMFAYNPHFIIVNDHTSHSFDALESARYMFAYTGIQGATLAYNSGYIPIPEYYNFASLKDATGMYKGARFNASCSNLPIPANLENAEGMFAESNVTSIGGTYNNKIAPTSVTNFSYGFYKCRNLARCYINLSNECDCSYMFYYSTAQGVGMPFEKIQSGYMMFAYSAISELADVLDGSLANHLQGHFYNLQNAAGMFQCCERLGDFVHLYNGCIYIGNAMIESGVDCTSMFRGTCGWNSSGAGEPNISIEGSYIRLAKNMFANMRGSGSTIVSVTSLGYGFYMNDPSQGCDANGMFSHASGFIPNVSLKCVINTSDMFSYASCYKLAESMTSSGVSNYLYDASSMFEGFNNENNSIDVNARTTSGIRAMFSNWQPSPLLSQINCSYMFANCYTLDSMPLNIGQSLCAHTGINCTYMFSNCTNMRGDVTTNGNYMQSYCGYMFFKSAIDTVTNFGIKVAADGAFNMFDSCTNLKSASFIGSGPLYARDMFYNCISLETFSTSEVWSSLEKVDRDVLMGAWYGCKLNGDSFENIINTLLPDRSSYAYNLSYVDITLSEEGCERAAQLLNCPNGTIIPKYDENGYNPNGYTPCFPYETWKGWFLRLTCFEKDYTCHKGTIYDATEGTVHIPDASTWHSTAYTDLKNAGLKITRVEDYEAFND